MLQLQNLKSYLMHKEIMALNLKSALILRQQYTIAKIYIYVGYIHNNKNIHYFYLALKMIS